VSCDYLCLLGHTFLALRGREGENLSQQVPMPPFDDAVGTKLITPSRQTLYARFTFSVPEGISYEPGQWIALGFKE
jgi:hypothetical protein